MFCENCGTKARANENFCEQCGTKMEKKYATQVNNNQINMQNQMNSNENKWDGLKIASLVIGIIAILLSWLNLMILPLAIVGLILGLITKTKRKMHAGTILNIIAIVLAIVIFTLFAIWVAVAVVDEIATEIEREREREAERDRTRTNNNRNNRTRENNQTSDETLVEELNIALINAGMSGDVTSIIDRTDSPIAPYQAVVASNATEFTGGSILYFFRDSPDSEWQFFGADMGQLQCLGFEDVQRPFAGTECHYSKDGNFARTTVQNYFQTYHPQRSVF